MGQGDGDKVGQKTTGRKTRGHPATTLSNDNI